MCRSHDPKRIYQRRMALGLSMRGLADRAGVALGTISRAENGHELWAGTLGRIAKGLGCAVVDLMHPDAEGAE